MSSAEWAGRDLGSRTVAWTERDAILYALAIGARPGQLDLVFEERLRVLPTFGLTLAQWAPDVLAEAGAWEVGRAVHGSQSLEMRSEIPPRGEIELHARVGSVWDKGAAAVFEIEVECDHFLATWSIFAPGSGGFGGDRGPSRPAGPAGEPTRASDLRLADNAAVLYRLLGDRHHIHVDPEAAAGIGQPRPILHGLATLGSAVLCLAEQLEVHPATLWRLDGRFSGVVFPGETIKVESWHAGEFWVATGNGIAIDGGHVEFGPPAG